MGKKKETLNLNILNIPRKAEPGESTQRFILVKLLDLKGREKKVSRQKDQITLNGNEIKLLSDFSAATHKARQHW